jgi:hypothetical protein
VFVIVGVLIGILFLEESHEDKKHRRDPGLELGQWILEHLQFKGRVEQEKGISEETALFIPANEKNDGLSSTNSSPRLSSVSTNVSEVEVYLPKSTLSGPRPSLAWREMFNNQVLLVVLSLGVLAL